MANMKQLGALVTPSHKEMVERVADENSWSVNETVRKAIEALADLMTLHESTAIRLGPDLGPLWVRLAREMGAARMVNKGQLTEAVLDNGQKALIVDDFTFYDEDGRLLAMQEVDGRKDVYEVEGGRLIQVAVFPLGDPQNN